MNPNALFYPAGALPRQGRRRDHHRETRRGETPDTVRNIYLEAYRLGLKGVTVFRDQSRERQVLSCDKGRMCDA
jgi:ribonucleotide reductase alpha subunit